MSAWASKWTMPMLPGRRTSAIGAGARPGDGVVAAEDDRDRAGRGDLVDLAIDHRVAALPVRGHDVRVAGVDDGQLIERADIELERVQAARTCTAPRGWPAVRTACPAGG